MLNVRRIGAALVCAVCALAGCRAFAGYGEGRDDLGVPASDVSDARARTDLSHACDHPEGSPYALPLTVDDSQLRGTHAHFPLVVDIVHPLLQRATAGGHDIRFVDEQGVTLPSEIEALHHGPQPRLIAHVRIPLLAVDGRGARICVYFGDASAQPPASAAVWSEYVGVFHFSAEPFVDASPRALKVSGVASTSSDGVIGSALKLDGHQSLTLRDGAADEGASFTVAMWVQARALAAKSWIGLLSKGRESDREWFGFWARPSGDEHLLTFGWTGYRSCCPWGTGNIEPNERLTLDSWRYLVGTFDSETKIQRFYIDGELVGQRTNDYRTIQEDTVLGLNNPPGELPRYYHGLLDELRISRKVRSADWIATQYHNQRAPRSFVSVGVPRCIGPCP